MIPTHPLRFLPVLAVTMSLAACNVPAPEPTPAPSPTPAPAPAPPPIASQPSYDNWLDNPQTAGTWTYRDEGNATRALFGLANTDARFAVHCSRSTRQITLMRAGDASGTRAMRIRTETSDRLLDAQPLGDSTPLLAVRLNARDPLLDAIAFSRGRFAVEVEGQEALYLPPWAEISRVIEDCR